MQSVRSIRRGFTLIEFLATMVILATIAGVAGSIIFSAVDGYAAASARAQLQSELSVALDRIVRELRSLATQDPQTGAPDLVSMASQSMTWGNGSGVRLSGNILEVIDAGGAPARLASDVTQFTVTAFDENGSVIALPLDDAGCDSVRRVGVTLAATRNGTTEQIRTRIFLRATIAKESS